MQSGRSRTTMKAMVPVIRYVRPIRPVDFPSTSPEWDMVQSGPHMRLCDALDAIVRSELRGRACVGKDQLVYFDGADRQRCCAPDLLVRLDTPARTFQTWKTWEDGTPDLCVEVLSPSDHEKPGFEDKLARYRAMGLPELVAFDPDAPRGERLRAWDRVDGDLVERVVEHERTPCRALGLWLVIAPVLDSPDLDAALHLPRDAGGEDLLLTDFEQRVRDEIALDAERAEKERERAEKEAALAEKEAALAELARLRKQLEGG